MGFYIADLSVLVANLKNETKWRIYMYIYKSPPLFQIFGLIFFSISYYPFFLFAYIFSNSSLFVVVD